jgi:hypothetical protein
LQKPHKFFDGDAGMSDEFPQQAAIELAMIRNGEVTAVGMIVNHVTAGMVIIRKAELGKCSAYLPARYDRQRGH